MCLGNAHREIAELIPVHDDSVEDDEEGSNVVKWGMLDLGEGASARTVSSDVLRERHLQRAEEYYDMGIELARSLTDCSSEECDVLVADLYGNLGDVQSARLQPVAALEFYEDAIRVYRQLRRPADVARIHYNIGLLFKDTGNLSKSKEVPVFGASSKNVAQVVTCCSIGHPTGHLVMQFSCRLPRSGECEEVAWTCPHGWSRV